MTTPTVSQLVYLSRATMYVDRTELIDIAAVSQRNNRRAGITGALLFCDGYFLQILEGDRATIEATLEHIGQDVRHADVQVIERLHEVPRSFADWDMASLHEASMTDAQAARAKACIAQAGRDELIDRIGNDAHQLLVDLRDAIAAEATNAARDAA